jgi:uncharacterized protein YutE (UPF0331/DUF86 family)
MTDAVTEAEVLRNAVAELEQDGYEVFIQPQPPILPIFLKDFRPDAIARRNGENLVIEIVKTLQGRDQALAAMTSSIRAHPGWELRVIVVNPITGITGLTKQSLEVIRQSVHEVSMLVASGHYRAALLMAWSTFEALARLTMPSDFERPQSPGRLVQMLAQEGYLTPSEADVLRGLAAKRSVLIHGNVQTEVSKTEAEAFVAILNKLIETQQSLQ